MMEIQTRKTLARISSYADPADWGIEPTLAFIRDRPSKVFSLKPLHEFLSFPTMVDRG